MDTIYIKKQDVVNTSTENRLNALETNVELTTTRTENSYVNATSFNRIKAWKRGGVLVLVNNLNVANIPANTEYFEIGKVNGWNAMQGVTINIPGQSSTAHLYFNISASGVMSVGNYSSTAASGFFRGEVVAFES